MLHNVLQRACVFLLVWVARRLERAERQRVQRQQTCARSVCVCVCVCVWWGVGGGGVASMCNVAERTHPRTHAPTHPCAWHLTVCQTKVTMSPWKLTTSTSCRKHSLTTNMAARQAASIYAVLTESEPRKNTRAEHQPTAHTNVDEELRRTNLDRGVVASSRSPGAHGEVFDTVAYDLQMQSNGSDTER
jgi:hypothetical protein